MTDSPFKPEGQMERYIEVMPMGDMGEAQRVDQYWPLSDLRARLAERFTLVELDERTGGPARYLRLAETGQKIGLITPLTHNFCESCNRVRLTCTGELYMCLGQEDMADLRAPLRASASDAVLEAAIRSAITRKPKGHDFDYSRGKVAGQVSRHMSHTGGKTRRARIHGAPSTLIPASAPRPCPHTNLRQTGSHRRRSYKPDDAPWPCRRCPQRYRPPGGH